MNKCWCGQKPAYVHKVVYGIGTVGEETKFEFHCWEHAEELWERVKEDPDSKILAKFSPKEYKLLAVMDS